MHLIIFVPLSYLFVCPFFSAAFDGLGGLDFMQWWIYSKVKYNFQYIVPFRQASKCLQVTPSFQENTMHFRCMHISKNLYDNSV